MDAPLGLQKRFTVVKEALRFFSANTIFQNALRKELGLPLPDRPRAFMRGEFIMYLEHRKVFDVMPYQSRIMQLIDLLERAGFLMRFQPSGQPSGFWNEHYYYMNNESARRKEGYFWLTPILGGDFLVSQVQSQVVQIVGKNREGDETAGTGLVVDPQHVLTCRHVLEDMDVAKTQYFQGMSFEINQGSLHLHADEDVGLLRVDRPSLTPVPGLLFQPPIVTKDVFTIGYPKLPRLREAALIVQLGAVTNSAVTELDGKNLFLYSAISRPGNSGGPVISTDGYVIGIAAGDCTMQDSMDNELVLPHHAGVPAQVLAKSVRDLKLGLELPMEPFV